MKVYLTVLMAVLLIGVSSCSTETPDANVNQNSANNSSTGNSNSANAADEEEVAVPKSKDAKATREQIEAKDAAEAGLGPTDVIRAFNDSVIKRDAAKIRSFLSRASMKMIEDSAKEQRMTVDQLLTSDDGSPMPVEREMKDEKIDGDTATVEVKNSTLGSFDLMILVKENGNWRIALDKIRDEMIRRVNERQKNAPTPTK